MLKYINPQRSKWSNTTGMNILFFILLDYSCVLTMKKLQLKKYPKHSTNIYPMQICRYPMQNYIRYVRNRIWTIAKRASLSVNIIVDKVNRIRKYHDTEIHVALGSAIRDIRLNQPICDKRNLKYSVYRSHGLRNVKVSWLFSTSKLKVQHLCYLGS